MRVFNAESGWDKVEQKWIQILTIDGQEVDLQTYAMELEHETHDNEEGVIGCSCEDCDCEDTEDIYEDDCECMCPDCVDERKVIFIAEAVDMVFKEGLCCPQCLYELFESVYDKGSADGFDEGFEECKQEMKDFLED